MVKGGESFWSAVYEPFVARDLTRTIFVSSFVSVSNTLAATTRCSSTCFNMPADDYKRFMAVLRKYQCHLPFQQFRALRTESELRSEN